ncbi:RIO1 family regulatory kinase/ATPase [Lonepinella sp. MS14437]|uniref:RIO1 family regulatory kinase/ATPase domain-containing protein n=1 Tax=Lonepinella sp. MS14437 TaxID=3003620 RepID=UPI0036D85A15
MTLEQYAQSLCFQYPDKRVYPFEFENKHYWLKQPEHPQGSQRLLKPCPRKFFHQEVERLLKLQQQNAPIPFIYVANENMLVMEDAGLSVSHWLEKEDISAEQKQQILNDSATALARLHQQGLIHGRPFAKDILWKDGVVKFIDFEVDTVSKNPFEQQIQDSVFFVFGLCREKSISLEQIKQTILTYQSCTDKEIWQASVRRMTNYRLIYWLLRPFKKIAGKDLNAFYLLMENMR